MPPSTPNMPGPNLGPPVDPAHVAAAASLGHEPHRFNVKAVAACGLGLAFLGLVIHLIVTGFVATVEPGPRSESTPFKKLRTVLPQDISKIRRPVLQAANDDDMKALRKKDDALLSEYGWVDRAKGTVRIPIARAIELLAKEKGR